MLISAVAQIVLSSPLSWLHRREALDTVFKERWNSYRKNSEGQGLQFCAHSNCAVGRLGKISCFNWWRWVLGVQKQLSSLHNSSEKEIFKFPASCCHSEVGSATILWHKYFEEGWALCLNSKLWLEGTGSRFQKSVGVEKAKLYEGESWASGVAGKSSKTSGVQRASCETYCIFICVCSLHSADFNFCHLNLVTNFLIAMGREQAW